MKPANVALGEYGQVVLLDWGLARLEGKKDLSPGRNARYSNSRNKDVGFRAAMLLPK